MTNFKLTGIFADITAFLTILAALPYELGPVADIIPPTWKTYVASTGAIATLVLRLIKRGQAQAAADALAATAAGIAITADALAQKQTPAPAAAAPIQPQQPVPVTVVSSPSNPVETHENK